VPSQVDFFCLPFLSLDLSFFVQLYFLLASHSIFLKKIWNFSHPPTYYPPLSPFDLFTYIFKLKVNSSPSTYSPINLKCVTLISTHLPTPPSMYLPTCPSNFLPTNTLSRYLPNPTYMVTPTYMVATLMDPQWLTMMRKEKNEGITWRLVLFTQTNK
jgi:hypothetical protein